MSKTLRLTLKKKWYDMIAAGIKKEEYREIKPYWFVRLLWLHSEVENVELFCDELMAYCKTNEQGFYLKLICAEFAFFNNIEFKNGYGKNAPIMLVEFKGIDIGPAVPEWSDNWQGDVFRIKLGNIISKTQQQ